MALSTAGLHTAAERAFDWLARSQRSDGSWHHYYLSDGVEDAKVDTNSLRLRCNRCVTSLPTTGDKSFLEGMWLTVKRALDFVVGHQTASGHIPWAIHTSGTPWSYSLVTGSSSILHSTLRHRHRFSPGIRAPRVGVRCCPTRQPLTKP